MNSGLSSNISEDLEDGKTFFNLLVEKEEDSEVDSDLTTAAKEQVKKCRDSINKLREGRTKIQT